MNIRSFEFRLVGYGHYKVKYTSPERGDYWVCTISDMLLIDATKNAEAPKASDLQRLYRTIKRNGTHYSKYGDKIY